MSNDDNPFTAGQASDLGGDQPTNTIYEPVPLDVGAVLERTFELLRDNPATVLGAVLLSIAPGVLIGIGDFVMQLAVASLEDPDISMMYSVASLGLSFVSFLIGVFLQLGLVRILLNVSRGHDAEMGMLVSQGHLFVSGIVAAMLVGLVSVVGTLLCIVPGVIAYLGLQFFTYLIVDRGLGPIEALSQSWALTDGNKLNLFVIGLVFFIGGLALTCLTLGIGYLLIVPLMTVAQAVMYHSLLHTHPDFAG